MPESERPFSPAMTDLENFLDVLDLTRPRR